jgi:hypothetical protein
LQTEEQEEANKMSAKEKLIVKVIYSEMGTGYCKI